MHLVTLEVIVIVILIMIIVVKTTLPAAVLRIGISSSFATPTTKNAALVAVATGTYTQLKQDGMEFRKSKQICKQSDKMKTRHTHHYSDDNIMGITSASRKKSSACSSVDRFVEKYLEMMKSIKNVSNQNEGITISEEMCSDVECQKQQCLGHAQLLSCIHHQDQKDSV